VQVITDQARTLYESRPIVGRRRSRWASLGRRVLAWLCAALLLLTVLSALAAPLLAPHDPLAINLRRALELPSAEHLLGTDHLGRDILSRMLYGARGSLGAAAAIVVVSSGAGLVVGLVAGYLGGWVDELAMRCVDIVLALPSFVLALVLAGILGPGLLNVVLAMALVRWASPARVVRSLVLSLREREFVMAARVVGASDGRVVFRHLLPNVLGPLSVLATLNLGSAILGLAGLSFVGLGTQIPHPEWGAMLNQARPYIQTVPRLMVIPGVAIALSVFAANVLGDALRDRLDPTHARWVGSRENVRS
jgi:peptide/nickel transport system permease protein